MREIHVEIEEVPGAGGGLEPAEYRLEWTPKLVVVPAHVQRALVRHFTNGRWRKLKRTLNRLRKRYGITARWEGLDFRESALVLSASFIGERSEVFLSLVEFDVLSARVAADVCARRFAEER